MSTDPTADRLRAERDECVRVADGDCNGPATFEVVYRSAASGKVMPDQQDGPLCFRHALAHVDRAVVAGSIASPEMRERSQP